MAKSRRSCSITQLLAAVDADEALLVRPEAQATTLVERIIA